MADDIGAAGQDPVFGAGRLALVLAACGVDADCDNGLFCDGAETCHVALGCRAGTPPCGDGVSCTADTCNEAGRACASAPNDDACDDGDPCTADLCDAVNGAPATGCLDPVLDPPPPECMPEPVLIAADGFESGRWTGGTGWLGAWSKSGDASLRSDAGPHTGTRHARLQRSTGLITRSVNLSGVTDGRLRLWAKVVSFESADTAAVLVSPDGGAWTTLHTFTPADSGTGYRAYDLDLSGVPMSANFRVRVDANMNSTNDHLYVDDVEVVGVLP